MQGTIKTATDTVTTSALSVWAQVKTDFKSYNTLQTFYGPILTLLILLCLLKLGGLLSSCLACWPVQIVFMGVIVFVFAAVLLKIKCNQYCRTDAEITSICLFASMPCLIYCCVFVAVSVFLRWLPFLGDFVAILVGLIAFSTAISYSQVLCRTRVCDSVTDKTFWTFFN